MIFNPKNPYDIDRADAYYQKLRNGDRPFELKARLPVRTTQQNRYLHLILAWFASETGYSVGEVKINYFKRLCNKELFLRTKVNKFGREISFLRSSSELTTGEMTTAIERFRNWSASKGLYLPAPNEGSYLLYIEQEMEKQKEYL